VAGATNAYYTVADSRYFLGAVALVNSLRLTGNLGEVVVVDAGLLPDQRRFLGRECAIVDPKLNPAVFAVFAKPAIHHFEQEDRTVVILDSDVIVTRSLDEIVESAEHGLICGFVNNDTDRWFPEWADMFDLREPLRRQPFLNSSCLALSLNRWRGLLRRWEELCRTIQDERSKRPLLLRRDQVLVDPVGFPEQDVLNALLMSEVPADAIRSWSHDFVPSWADRRHVSVLDAHTLHCDFSGREPFYIEWTGTLKPWMQWGWVRQRYEAYLRLFPRVVLANDVPLRLSSSEVPPWMRGTMSARGRYRVLNGGAVFAYRALGIVPDSLRSRLSHALRTLLSRTPSAPSIDVEQ
jgi:hypothetical protein